MVKLHHHQSPACLVAAVDTQAHLGTDWLALGISRREVPSMTEIKPALNAEEWAEWLKSPAANSRSPFMAEQAWGAMFGSHADSGKSLRHAHGAIALHGQPFGFTREMVRELRLLGHPSQHHEGIALACDAIDRIEALLPPEETHAKRQHEDTDDAENGHHESQVGPGVYSEDDDTSGQGSGKERTQA